MLPRILIVTLALALPAVVSAYGAVHVGSTQVGPAGVYHTGETAYRGPAGATATTQHTTAVGGAGAVHETTGVYRGPAGATAGVHTTTAATGGYAPNYHYAPNYAGASSGAAVVHSTDYRSLR